MAVTKRTRFEVLKRDNYTCRYCGGTAPDVVLTIDHVLPVALGGTDDPTNLVAACKDCNAGKSSTAPDAELVADVAEDAARWARAIQQAAEELRQHTDRHGPVHDFFLTEWRRWDSEAQWLPSDYKKSIDGWIDSGLQPGDLADALDVATANRMVHHRDVFRYMVGVIKNKLAAIHERAREIAEGGD
jgi:hypothetical protein